MKGLLVKDLKIFSKQFKIYLLIVLGAFAISSVSSLNNLILYVMAPGFMFVQSSMSYDAFDNGYSFMFSLPITRKQYILEKYLLGVICIIGFMLIALVAMALSMLIKGQFDAIKVLVSSMSTAVVFFLIECLTIPVYLKFGAQRIAIVFIGIAMLLGALISGIWYIFRILGLNMALFLSWILSLNYFVLTGMGILILIGVFSISYKISVRVIKNKDF